MLTVDRIDLFYGAAQALRSVSIKAETGRILTVLGRNGVGKSSLLAKFARGVDADVVVIALIGERGRELRDFVERVLGPDGMARAVVVTATSDQSASFRDVPVSPLGSESLNCP